MSFLKNPNNKFLISKIFKIHVHIHGHVKILDNLLQRLLEW